MNASYYSYHIKMFQRLSNSLLLFWCCSRLSAIFRLRLIIILSFNNSVLSLDLGYVQVSNMYSILFLYPIPYLIIGSSILETISIHAL